MNIQRYLNRIDFHETITINKEVLFKLQEKHLLNIPFENLDIHYKRPIRLSFKEMFEKIVINNRGGFCYELNGLFHSLLKELGFNAKIISARVHTNTGEFSPEFDHLAIIVTLGDEQYLVDVGFGKFTLHPLKINFNETVYDSYGDFKFDTYSAGYFRVNEIKNTNIIPQYIFKNKARQLSDFTAMCSYHQTNERSHFTKKKLISIATKNGRITLNNSQLKVTNDENEQVINFNESEFEEKLKEYFNIENFFHQPKP
ncbi:arylamine N-acetyltransferase family protein [Maribacter forsetii]|uniref:arylamine N-acetyltransferase family protein n=1 Tax=Maribacter forsetii TaxID=444515 RepID=UPI00056BFECE|nr:arylamine N-acetyltransferase [Maribacter forsetii]